MAHTHVCRSSRQSGLPLFGEVPPLRLTLHSRRAAATAAGLLLGSGLAATGVLVGLPADAAAPGEPTLNLWAPANSMGYFYGGGSYLESTFKVIAGDTPVEI